MMNTKKFSNWMQQRIRIWTAKRSLSQLDDRALRDIGITRSEIDMIVKTSLGGNRHFDH